MDSVLCKTPLKPKSFTLKYCRKNFEADSTKNPFDFRRMWEIIPAGSSADVCFNDDSESDYSIISESLESTDARSGRDPGYFARLVGKGKQPAKDRGVNRSKQSLRSRPHIPDVPATPAEESPECLPEPDPLSQKVYCYVKNVSCSVNADEQKVIASVASRFDALEDYFRLMVHNSKSMYMLEETVTYIFSYFLSCRMTLAMSQLTRVIVFLIQTSCEIISFLALI